MFRLVIDHYDVGLQHEAFPSEKLDTMVIVKTLFQQLKNIEVNKQ